jgi:ribosomal-protein-alanine N-acetyltransferase
VRPFRVADAAAVHALARSAPEAAQWSVEGYERFQAAGQQGWVAESGGAVCGFMIVRIISPEMEILNVVVATESRRKGIAAALFSGAEKEARDKKVSRVFLEVRESNAAASAFYERHGFTKIGIRANYYRGPAESAVVMEKEIPA